MNEQSQQFIAQSGYAKLSEVKGKIQGEVKDEAKNEESLNE
jgi:hypothetical protein